jgi:octanoyl-[GcvH]:protein N-octanoyltransferase
VIGALEERYATVAEVIVEALTTVGVAARIGELEGEWCPGRWSILVGDGKVGGLAQRLVRGAAWTEAVLVISGARDLAASLIPVQAALDRPWSSATLMAVSDTSPHLTRD